MTNFKFIFISIFLQNIFGNQFFNPGVGEIHPNSNTQHLDVSPSSNFDPSKVLEVKTYVNGKIDPDDKINITTQIIDHINEETYYITPKFANIQGEFKYRQNLEQNHNNDKYQLTGDIRSEVKGDANMGIHIQQYDKNNTQSDKTIFKRYSDYLKKYIEYVYQKSIPINPEYLQDLQNQFALYGTQTDGTNPVIQSSFKSIKDKHSDSNFKEFDSVGGANSRQNNGFSYAVSNLNTDQDTNSFQNLISNATGKDPITGVNVKSSRGIDYVRGKIKGEAIAKESYGVNDSSIDAHGVSNQFGFSDNIVLGEAEPEKITAIGEIENLAVDHDAVHHGHVHHKNNYYMHKPMNKLAKQKYFAPKRFIQTWEQEKKNNELISLDNIGIRVPEIDHLNYIDYNKKHNSNQNYVRGLIQNNQIESNSQTLKNNINSNKDASSGCGKSNNAYNCF